MRSYEQMAQDALRRIEEYRAEKRKRMRAFTIAAVPVLSFLLVALIFLGYRKGGIGGEQHVPVDGTGMSGTHAGPEAENTVPEAGEPAEESVNGTAEPEEHARTEEGSGTVSGPFQGPRGEPAATSPQVIISDYPDAGPASYLVPETGKVSMSVPLQKALEEYGDEDVQFRVIVQIFDGKEIMDDKDFLLEEADRLYQLGYTAGIETIGYGYAAVERRYFFIVAGREQIEDFASRPDLGYFMFLYDEFMRAARMIEY